MTASTVVKDHQFKRRTQHGSYDWDSWFDGQNHRLVKGKHFHIDASKFRGVILSTAHRRKVKVRTEVDGNIVFVKKVGRITAKKAKKKKRGAHGR